MNQRVAHISLDADNTLVVPTPKELHLRIPLPDFIESPVKYECLHAGNHHTGFLDNRGEACIPLEYQLGEAEFRLWLLGEQDEPIEWVLELGLLASIDTVLGVQGRLKNLGMDPGPLDNTMGRQTRAALRYFQEQKSLESTGEPDETTKAALVDAYGC